MKNPFYFDEGNWTKLNILTDLYRKARICQLRFNDAQLSLVQTYEADAEAEADVEADARAEWTHMMQVKHKACIEVRISKHFDILASFVRLFHVCFILASWLL